MKRSYWAIFVAMLALLGLWSLAWLQKKVVIIIDGGLPQNHLTFSLTVGSALQEAGVSLAAADHIQPERDAWLSENMVISVDRAASVQINVDGKLINILSAARQPLDLLTEAGVSLHSGDALFSNGRPITANDLLPQAGSYNLQVNRPVTITLQTAGETQAITSTAATLGQALWQAGIRLHPADRLTPAASTPLTNTLTASLNRSQSLTIVTAEDNITLRSAAATVGEALAEAGLAPQGLDYTIPAASAPIPADGDIRLVRVREEVLLEQTTLPYGSDWQTVDDLELDQSKLVQVGEYGIQASRVRLRYEDGVEVSRVIESQWQARQPVNEIVGYGMKIVVHTLDTPDGTIEYYRALQFWATAYAPKYVGGSTRTASGNPLVKGMVAVDTDYIPYGTLMYVPGYGFAEAADTGRIIGRWIDLGYSDDDFEGWHQWVTVYFLWPPGYVPPFIPPPAHY